MHTQTLRDFMMDLKREGVTLYEDGGKLKYRSTQGGLKEADKQLLKEHKEDVLALIRREQNGCQPDPQRRYQAFPLTDVQSAYLLGRSQAFSYGGVACHIYLELHYPQLDAERAEEVWNHLIARHDMLRAVMDQEGAQRVLESVPHFSIAVTRAENWTSEKKQAHAQELFDRMGHRVYDTGQWPLFDLAITQQQEESVLHFSIEFLIADWASIWLLLAEFEAAYDGRELPAPAALQFRDYLLAERRLQEGAIYQKDRQYWLERLNTLPAAPDLPLKRQDQAGQAGRFTRKFLSMPLASWTALKKQAQQHGLTPTAAVMTAYARVLARWSQNQSFLLNLTVLNRLPLHPEVNRVVGDFTSVSLLAVDCGKRESFAEQVQSLQQQLFEDMDHRLFSGVEVMREITRRRGKEAALMPFVFTSAIGLVQATEKHPLRGKVKGQGISQTPQVFIDCQAMDLPEGLQVNWDIREGIFPAGMAEDMFAAFSSLLLQLAHQPEAWENPEEVLPLPAWQAEEREAVNRTAVLREPQLLAHAFAEKVRQQPDAIAVVDEKQSWTYGELAARAAGIAQELQSQGCRPGDRVGIAMDKSAFQAAAVLGVAAAGGVYVPLDGSQAAKRREGICHRTGLRHLLTVSDSKLSLPSGISVLPVDRIPAADGSVFSCQGQPQKLAYIIHTSGSTGEPKGVMISHQAAVNTIEDLNGRFAINPTDRLLALAQLTFDLSVYDIFGTLGAGGSLIYPQLERQTDPSHWGELIARQGITLWDSVPALMQMLLSYVQTDAQANISSLRLVMLSGDWIPLNLPQAIKKQAPAARIIGMGGATEASIWSNYHEYQGLHPDWVSIPYGRPLSNQSFRVLDANLRDCPVWVSGDLFIAGTGLAEGYYGDEETTKARFFQHPIDGQRLYRTGDRGRYWPGGELEFLGREDNQVKIKGYRIELGEVEAALQRHSAVAQAAVLVASHDQSRSLAAIVEPAAVEELTPEILRTFLQEYLPAYMIPESLYLIEKLPLTANGKVDRKSLAQWHKAIAAEPVAAQRQEEPQDVLEKELLAMWSQALGSAALGRTHNFYDHGADSLIMAQVAGKIREWYGKPPYEVEVAFDTLLRQMLNYPTVAELAKFLRELEKETAALPVTTAADKSSNAVLTPYGGGSNGPLRVVFHAGLGTMNCFRLLLSHLDKQQQGAIVGITVDNADRFCQQDAAGLIENLAEDYASRLLASGHKKMQLIGYCLGGLIAVETARRLVEKGVEIVDLVLIDSHPVLYAVQDDLVLESLFVPNLNISLEQAGFSGPQPEDFNRALLEIFRANAQSIPADSAVKIGGDKGLEQVGNLFRQMAARSESERFQIYVTALEKHTGNHMPAEMAAGLFRVYRQSLLAANFYPQPYVGDIRFLLAEEPFSLMPGGAESTLAYWEEVCLGEFSVETIGGNHLTCIESEPHASNLAEKVSQGLLRQTSATA